MKGHHDSDDDVQLDPETGFATEPSSDMTRSAEQLPQTDESLGQVRRILLGPLSGEMDERLSSMRKQIDQSIEELSQETASRTAELASRLSQEVDRWSRAVEEKHETQSRELAAATDDLERKIEQLTEQISAIRDGLNDELDRRLGEFSSKLAAELPAQADRLREELVDRDTLSSMLSEVALRIGGPLSGLTGDLAQTEAELDSLLGGPESGS